MASNAQPFACRRCAACCRWPGAVLLTGHDVAVLAAHQNLPEEDFIATYTVLAANRAQLALQNQPDDDCIFLDDQNRCRVYPARPRQCREFPLQWRVPGCPACETEAAVLPIPAGRGSGLPSGQSAGGR